jgi:hypothetical protein
MPTSIVEHNTSTVTDKMRLTSLAITLLGAFVAVNAESRTAAVYVQPVITPSSQQQPPTLLAEVRYDTISPSTAEITNYEPPSLPDPTPKLLRIGIYDPSTSRWASSTTVTSPENFSKGYAPHFVLTVDGKGDILGASVRGVKIDAGHTRDFGPQALVVVTSAGKQPDLNKPVVLSPEGRKVQPEAEKTLLQKYVDNEERMITKRWFTNVFCLQVLVGLGYWSCSSYGWWWRRRKIEIGYAQYRIAFGHGLTFSCYVLLKVHGWLCCEAGFDSVLRNIVFWRTVGLPTYRIVSITLTTGPLA